MSYLRKSLAAVCAVGAVAIVALALAHSGNTPPIWTAPKGERIRFVRTGNQKGHFLVLSESDPKGKWYLRDVSVDGRVSYCISGNGPLQSTVPLSPLSWKGDKVLVGLGNVLDEPLRAVVCDLAARKVVPLSTDSVVVTFLLTQPFSPDDLHIGWIGNISGKRGEGIRVLSLQTGEDHLIRPITGGWNLGWAKDGKLHAFNMRNGDLLSGTKDGLVLQRKLPPGIVGAVSPDGNWCLVIAFNGAEGITIYTVDMPNGKAVAVYSTKELAVPCCGIEWSPNGQEVVISGDERMFPLMIGRDHSVRRVVAVPKHIVGAGGAALLDPDHLAVVEGEVGSQGRIVAIEVSRR
jgi:hypothetical protein